MLTKRMVDILSCVVDEFVETAEPVASITLVDKYHLPYSSATLRNDMAALEAMGYLEKPHTSAGRVPSSKGYQFYCEHLMPKEIDEEVKYALTSIFKEDTNNIEDVIKQSCAMISEMTNLTTGILGDDANEQTLEYIQVFPLDTKTAVCVFVTNTGHTENKTFNFSEDITSDDIKTCANILNDRLKGTSIKELKTKLESIRPILVTNVKQHELLFNAFVGAFAKFATEKLYFSGASKMMYQPEFADIEKLKDLIKMIENPKLLKELTNMDNVNDCTAITPDGTELFWKDDLAIVSSKIHINRNDTGRLLVVGPKRMDYSRVASLMDFIAKEIEDIYK